MSSLKILAGVAGMLMVCACATAPPAAPTQAGGAPPSTIGEADRGAVSADDEMPRATELKNTLRWTTASEVENFGFDIYRGTSEDGPFERMTTEPLPGAGTIDEPQHYVWEDTTIEAGVDYYYYIESISYAGVREQFSPVIRSPAKH